MPEVREEVPADFKLKIVDPRFSAAPKPPKVLKCDIYEGPEDFKEVDELARNVRLFSINWFLFY